MVGADVPQALWLQLVRDVIDEDGGVAEAVAQAEEDPEPVRRIVHRHPAKALAAVRSDVLTADDHHLHVFDAPLVVAPEVGCAVVLGLLESEVHEPTLSPARMRSSSSRPGRSLNRWTSPSRT